MRAAAYKRYSDPELVAMCLGGDAHAWEALIRRYRRFIFSIPVKFGFADSDASDVFQTVCLKLLEHLHEVRDDRKISGWLATTATRQCFAMRFLKQRESGTEEDIVEPEDPSGTLEDMKLYAEECQLLRETIEELPDRCKSLIEMLYFDLNEPTYEEIRARLGIQVSAIGPTKARCLDKLRLMLRKKGVRK